MPPPTSLKKPYFISDFHIFHVYSGKDSEDRRRANETEFLIGLCRVASYLRADKYTAKRKEYNICLSPLCVFYPKHPFHFGKYT